MKKIILALFLLLPLRLLSQEINCNNSEIIDAYNLAKNTVDINIRRGILAAGGDYGGEWTRDISINTWNCVSLLNPKVAERSLWSVTIDKDSIGHQYWDRIIWTIAALNHYNVTGDSEFLKQSYKCSATSIKLLEEQVFDNKYGLFSGPSVFNDGIAAYPAPLYDSANSSNFVLDHKNTREMKCLSTNCVYYGAYKSLIEMAKILKDDSKRISEYEAKAGKLKTSILKYFFNEKENKLYYLIDNLGAIDKSQEGLGIAFAAIFGLINKDQAYQATKNARVSQFGITSIYPDFPRYSREKSGRHNNIIWPMVNGFFAQAAILANNYASFDIELDGLTHLALDEKKGNYQFWEIYNSYTGAPDGGWQGGYQWQSCRLQTWSATAYINMIHYGIAGLRFDEYGIKFAPYLPKSINFLELKNIKYRQALLNITLKGSGSKIKSFLLNGNKLNKYAIDGSITGNNDIVIELE